MSQPNYQTGTTSTEKFKKILSKADENSWLEVPMPYKLVWADNMKTIVKIIKNEKQ